MGMGRGEGRGGGGGGAGCGQKWIEAARRWWYEVKRERANILVSSE